MALINGRLGRAVINILGEEKYNEFKNTIDNLTSDDESANFKYERGQLVEESMLDTPQSNR